MLVDLAHADKARAGGVKDLMGVEEASAEKTPLEERLIDLIKANGPITIADYMADALGHPHDGYYTSQTPIGAEGDFTTAPEISQAFGELIGLWLVQAWMEMGEPKAFNLVELGPGRGVLMADVLRAARLRPEFLKAAGVWLVETSGRLRHEQQRRLRAHTLPPLWVDDFLKVPPAPLLLIANEFFDCLPIRQFELTRFGWRERLVDVGANGKSLSFIQDKTPPSPEVALPPADERAVGEIVEICESGFRLAHDIATAVAANGGRALVIDYGYFGMGGDTLQAVRKHKFWPVLSSPGKADITAHVNFEALSRAAIDAGASAWGPVAQGVFLDRLGLTARIARLSTGKSEAEIEAIARSARRIAAPEEMGDMFKAFCISAPSLSAPAGFEAP